MRIFKWLLVLLIVGGLTTFVIVKYDAIKEYCTKQSASKSDSKSDSKSKSEPKKGEPANNPKLALHNTYKALVEDDKETFVKTYKTKNKAQEWALKQMYDFMHVFEDFKGRLRKEYGPSKLEIDWTDDVEEYASSAWLKNPKTKIKYDGKFAYISVNGNRKYSEKVERVGKDQWLTSWPFVKTRPEAVGQLFRILSRIYVNAMDKIGSSGYNAKKIDLEVYMELGARALTLCDLFEDPDCVISIKSERKSRRRGKSGRTRPRRKFNEADPSIQIIPICPN